LASLALRRQTMAAEQPKKVTGGAFGRFLSEKRSDLQKECSGQQATAVVKLASERFKALGEAERAEYEKKYKEAVVQYNRDMEAFLAAGGEKKAPKRKGKDEEGNTKRRKKDPEAPKRPAGGAYGCFLAKHRAEFQEQCKGQPASAVSKVAGEKWKQLSEEEKKPFEEEYAAKREAYQAAMKDYVPPEPQVDEKATAKQAKEEAKQAKQQAKEEAKAAKQQAKLEAREAKDAAKASETGGRGSGRGRGRGAGAGRGRGSKAPAAPTVELQATVAAKAEKDGLKESLIKLASRQDIIDSKATQTAMLKALQETGGLIHPAKRALLGA